MRTLCVTLSIMLLAFIQTSIPAQATDTTPTSAIKAVENQLSQEFAKSGSPGIGKFCSKRSPIEQSGYYLNCLAYETLVPKKDLYEFKAYIVAFKDEAAAKRANQHTESMAKNSEFQSLCRDIGVDAKACTEAAEKGLPVPLATNTIVLGARLARYQYRSLY